ncbi:MAG: radical SAM protein [Malacoplasma sp.]|nr:radical SAM protein [Malacoplasma sp.]
MNYIYLNSIMKNPSLCDGPGYRTVIFFQGCNLKCKGCHNVESWPLKKGEKIKVSELAERIKKISFNKKITISGGEPLLQIDGLIQLLDLLDGFDICLYTGKKFEDVPKEILKKLKYLKFGPYIQSLKTYDKPFVGSKNQEFWELENGKTKQKW